MTNQQGAPEALRLADELDAEAGRITQYTNRPGDLLRELSAAELRRLHSEVTTLQAELAAMRAGGEPVGYIITNTLVAGDRAIVFPDKADRAPKIFPRTPVYAHPQPAAQDAERLDWLRWKMPGDSLRYVVGELADTSDAAEFRAAIDAAIAAQQGDSNE